MVACAVVHRESPDIVRGETAGGRCESTCKRHDRHSAVSKAICADGKALEQRIRIPQGLGPARTRRREALLNSLGFSKVIFFIMQESTTGIFHALKPVIPAVSSISWVPRMIPWLALTHDIICLHLFLPKAKARRRLCCFPGT